MPIDTREELVAALHVAAEIEHGLMIQYLFPALSMKTRLTEGLTGPQLAAARRWEGTILRVAVEEMGHLGTVSNLLGAIGESAWFDRPNFPQTTGYYPFAFDLVGFDDEALYRMLVFELPRGQQLPDPPRRPENLMRADDLSPAPDPLEFTYVGDLYAQIRDGIAAIDHDELFIGPPEAQVDDEWSVDLDTHAITDRDSAFAAIDDIILDGEGAPENRNSSHYGRFLAIRDEYGDAGLFEAGRAVVRNPQTRRMPGVVPGTLLTHEPSVRVAEVFNEAYAVVLVMLAHVFTSGEGPAQRNALKSAAGQMMSTALRPLAEVLTGLPAFADGDHSARAAPTFELYRAPTLSPFPAARWTVLLDRLHTLAAAARALDDVAPRLGVIGQTLSFLRRNLSTVAPP
jgi:Ferritin-like